MKLLIFNTPFDIIDQGLSKHQEVSFTPVTKVSKVCVAFLVPPWCHAKVDPDIYVSCGLYELLVSIVAHQMKGK